MGRHFSSADPSASNTNPVLCGRPFYQVTNACQRYSERGLSTAARLRSPVGLRIAIEGRPHFTASRPLPSSFPFKVQTVWSWWCCYSTLKMRQIYSRFDEEKDRQREREKEKIARNVKTHLWITYLRLTFSAKCNQVIPPCLFVWYANFVQVIADIWKKRTQENRQLTEINFHLNNPHD